MSNNICEIKKKSIPFFPPESTEDVDPEMLPQTLIKFREIYKVSTEHRVNTETMKQRLRTLLDLFNEQQQGEIRRERERDFKALRDTVRKEQAGTKLV